MAELVRYRREGQVGVITMDDGKVNALSPSMFAAINAGLDQAESDGVAVIIEGREGVFSAGFDLKTLRGGGVAAVEMVGSGFRTAERIMGFRRPVIMACTGHAFAMGVFLMEAGDYCVGTRGDFTLATNEVAIGLSMPRAAIEILRPRLTPAAVQRAVLLAERFDPDAAVAAGFLDRVVEADRLPSVAMELAVAAAALDPEAHAASKLRLRGASLEALRAAIELDDADRRDWMPTVSGAVAD